MEEIWHQTKTEPLVPELICEMQQADGSTHFGCRQKQLPENTAIHLTKADNGSFHWDGKTYLVHIQAWRFLALKDLGEG